MSSAREPRVRRPAWPWIVAAAVLLATLLPAAAFVYVTPERARAFAQRMLSRAVQRQVQFTSAHLSLWPPFGVEVRNLAVSDPGGFGRGRLLDARRVRLGLSAWALLTGELRLTGVRIESPRLRLVQDERGRGNWEDLGRRSPRGGAAREFSLVLRDLHLENGSLVYAGADRRAQLAVTGLEVDLAGRGGRWELGATAGRIRTAGGSARGFGPLRVEADVTPGRGGRPGEVRYVAELGSWLTEGRGVLRPQRLEVSGGRLLHEGSSLAVEDLAAVAEFDSATLRLSRLTGRLGRSPFEVAAALRPGPVRGLARVHLDLADLARLRPPAGGGTASGRVQIAVRFTVRAPRPDGVDLDGTAILNGVSWLPRDPEAREVTGVSGRVWLRGDAASVSGLRGRYGPLPFELNARVERPLALASALDRDRAPGAPVASARFDLATGAVDMAQLFPPGKRMERAPALAAQGILRAPRVRAGRLDAEAVTVQMRYDRGLLALDGARGRAYGGELSASGRMDFRVIERPRYDLRVQAESMDAAALLASWTPFPDLLRGRVDAQMSVNAAGFEASEAMRTLTAIGMARAVSGRLRGSRVLTEAARWTGLSELGALDFRDLLWRFRIQQGGVELADTWIRTGAGDYLVGGRVGLDGALGLDVSAALPAARLASLPAQVRTAAGFFRDDQGRLLLDFRVSGTVREPRFAWRTDRAAARLAQRLEDEALGRVRPLQAAFEDSLARVKAAAEARLEQEVARRRAEVNEAVEREQRRVRDEATGWLEDLLRGRPLPDTTGKAPGPAAAPDSVARADTARAGP